MKNKLTKQAKTVLIIAVFYTLPLFSSFKNLISGNSHNFFSFISSLLLTASFYLIFYVLRNGKKFKVSIPIIFVIASVAEICGLISLLSKLTDIKLAFFAKMAVVIVTLLILLAAVLKKYDWALKLYCVKVILATAFYIYYVSVVAREYGSYTFNVVSFVASLMLFVSQIIEALPFIYVLNNEKSEQDSNTVDLG